MIYFLRQKSDTLEATEKFLADAAPYGKVKRLRSDNGGEFISQGFKTLLRKHAIRHETSAPYSPHQNGTVERAWRSIFSMARCLLLEANLPKFLWTYAVMTAVYIRNRCFNSRSEKTPYEALTGKQPNLSKMHVFGSPCYVWSALVSIYQTDVTSFSDGLYHRFVIASFRRHSASRRFRFWHPKLRRRI